MRVYSEVKNTYTYAKAYSILSKAVKRAIKLAEREIMGVMKLGHVYYGSTYTRLALIYFLLKSVSIIFLIPLFLIKNVKKSENSFTGLIPYI